MNASENAIIVAGPTCSGKSALALHLAKLCCGTVINADSMQVYHDLHILTARPAAEDEAAVPHRLYGVLEASQAGSVAWWRQQALSEMQRCWQEGRVPILCGGTGMYLRSLTDGLVEVPDPGEEARREARTLLEEIGAPALYERLLALDPQTASRLNPQDSQRIARAWEVRIGTGRGLSSWQEEVALPPAPCRFVSVRLDPPRDQLRAAIAVRFERMIRVGALEEVKALLAKKLPPTLPVMRAHGVPELAHVLNGDSSLEEATEMAVRATGRYTRRQATWFRHHALGKEGDSIISFHRFDINEKLLESEIQKIENFMLNRIDLSSTGLYT
ncbi:tRNA (adenosine(37)-N6)-dimethylallyltransferase MiaA [Saccharibacter sp. 17.LH.SD]|uniref:tRNA (adenosine(37)-N6)-dimethylallyltransferase MiaA n=1 Tax=Saccharibacter sp. 17.LH.SD TaxID=2689393 RepID=UPI0013721792|nr:tRNA (adenosine(37)-N6)-dimethylallyltransferase MiaA [Saccharibacter sp. 17.LH.SD]MXV45127.1 tRNA (adenosine(37)-N6)-dimethylallyltransferase MiaA [Saccharibacter sp. 17.LH.SD]